MPRGSGPPPPMHTEQSFVSHGMSARTHLETALESKIQCLRVRCEGCLQQCVPSVFHVMFGARSSKLLPPFRMVRVTSTADLVSLFDTAERFGVMVVVSDLVQGGDWTRATLIAALRECKGRPPFVFLSFDKSKKIAEDMVRRGMPIVVGWKNSEFRVRPIVMWLMTRALQLGAPLKEAYHGCLTVMPQLMTYKAPVGVFLFVLDPSSKQVQVVLHPRELEAGTLLR